MPKMFRYVYTSGGGGGAQFRRGQMTPPPRNTLHHSRVCRRYLAKKQSQVKRTRKELDTEKMQKMQEEARKKLREYRKSFHRLADSAKKPKVVKYSKPTTESVGFEFRTDRRLRKRRAESAQHPSHSSVAHPNTFPMTLRSASNTSVAVEVCMNIETHTTA